MNKDKNINQLTFIAIMCSINVVFVILNLFLPLFSLIILIGIPFASALIKIRCSWKYTFIYLICSLLICILIDYQTTLFYLLSSIISGLTFGFLIKKNIHGFFIILISSFVNILIQFTSIYLFKILYNVDLIELFCQIISLDKNTFFNISLSFFFLISFLQNYFSYYIIEEEIKKFNLVVDENLTIFFPVFFIDVILTILSCALIKFPLFSYFFTSLSLIFSVYLLQYVFSSPYKKTKLFIIIFSCVILISSFIFIGFFKENGFHLFFNLFSLTSILNGVIFIIEVYCFQKTKISQVFNKRNDFSK